MFTGLIQEVGKLVARRGGAIEVQAAMARDLQLGESVAVQGICLTVTHVGGDRFTADVSASTLALTTAGSWAPGRRLNLERALALGDRLGGHLVSGHVDGVGRLQAKRRLGEAWQLRYAMPSELAPYLVSRGSIAVDGTSLTLHEAAAESFGVTIIPHTGAQTTLLEHPPGTEVNLEVDMLAKYVQRMLGAYQAPGLTVEKLASYGFGG